MNGLIPNIILLAISIFFLVRASYYVVLHLMRLSKLLKISLFVVSFIFLSISTSLAELSVGVNAALINNPELSLGDILGTNIVNLAFIMGILAVISGKLKLKDHESFRRDRPFILFAMLLPFFLLIDGSLSRIDGFILLGAFTVHMALLFSRAHELSTQTSLKHSVQSKVPYEHTETGKIIHSVLLFLISVAILLAAAYGVVSSITIIADILGVPEFIMGLIVIAIGTSLPELSVGLRSVLSKKSSISVGNLFGASTINMTLVLGVVSVIQPFEITQMSLVLASGAAIVFILLVAMAAIGKGKHELSRRTGLLLIAIYIGVLASQALIFGVNH